MTGNKAITCGDCRLPIGSRDKFVQCNGICGGCAFHIDCTELKDFDSQWDKLKNVGALKFFCKQCNESYNKIGLDGFMFAMIKTGVEKAVKAEMSQMNAKLDNLVASQTEQRPPGTPLINGNRRKRMRGEDSDVTPKFSNTYRDKLVFGTNENTGENAKLRGVQKPLDDASDDFKSIYLSQLDPSTEPKDVIEYLMDAKIIENDKMVKCIKLVSPKAISETFTYVSFKLDVPNDIYEKLVSPDIWPKSVAVREFVRKPRPTARFQKN